MFVRVLCICVVCMYVCGACVAYVCCVCTRARVYVFHPGPASTRLHSRWQARQQRVRKEDAFTVALGHSILHPVPRASV